MEGRAKILVWILYAVTVAALTGLAALVAERVLRLFRRPARWVWTAATGLSLLIPAIGWALADRPVPAAPDAPTVGVPRVETAPSPAGPTTSALAGWAGDLSRLDRPTGYLWLVGSGVLLLLIGGSALRLELFRRRWGRAEVEGQVVRLSQDVGPAVVGVLRPEIVLPSWVTGADEETRRWIVAHEREHLRAGDPLRLVASLLPVVLLPWNLPLWWQLRRLRQAVEIDCDERVLRRCGRSERHRYASLLLEVGRRGTRPLPVPAGFAETPTFLERRIRSMTAPRLSVSVFRATTAAALGALFLAGACMVPGPDRPGSPTAPDVEGEVREVPAEETGDRQPSFTPYTVAPKLLDEETVRAALEREYPPLLREAGIRGTARVHLFVDARGTVVDVLLAHSSGHPPLDAAALRVARTMKFGPALNRDEPVPVWITVPVTFGARETPPAAASPDVPGGTPAEPEPRPRNSRDISSRPMFTPYTRAPRLLNESEVVEALEREYPPLLRDAEVGGRTLVYFFIDEDGQVRDVRINQSSGHDALDAAALEVARVMEFSSALNRDEAVPVWISLPITFGRR